MKKVIAALAAVIVLLITLSVAVLPAFAAEVQTTATAGETQDASAEDTAAQSNPTGTKALAAALVVGIAAACGAISMGLAISKALEGIARQPEAEGKIKTNLMLGLVFIETLIIYALIVAILIIFVL